MGFLDFISRTKPRIDRTQFPQLCTALAKDLAILREHTFQGYQVAFENGGVNVSGAAGRLEKGSRLSSVFQAYQLTCIVGFAQRYLSIEDWVFWGQALTECLANEDPESEHETAACSENYLDCGGDIKMLSLRFSQDVYDLLERPTPRDTAMLILSVNAVGFAIMSQAMTARHFGDPKTERKLKAKLPGG